MDGKTKQGLGNPNVRSSLAFSLSISLSESSWGYTALSALLKEVGGNNKAVGLAEGFQGLSQLAFAMVAGRVADKHGRQLPLRMGAAVGLVAVASIWVGLFLVPGGNREFWAIGAGLAMWGAFRGVTLAPMDALFADSVVSKDRPRLMTLRYIATILGASLGPLLSFALFMALGDTWTAAELRKVIAVGTALSLVSFGILFTFRDEYAVQEAGAATADGSAAAAAVAAVAPEKADTPTNQTIRRLCFTADVIGGIASGMTIRFFPLFFKNEVGLSPGQTNTVTIATTLVMAMTSLSLQRLSQRAGRMPVIVASKILGISLLFIMAGFRSLWTEKVGITLIYIVRTAAMNATTPLHKSILMDATPRSRRGRWSAADSITAFGWSGSALLGGVLLDEHGYGSTFYITAGMQAMGCLPLVGLLYLVQDHSAAPPAAAVADTSSTTNGVSEPLLSSSASGIDADAEAGPSTGAGSGSGTATGTGTTSSDSQSHSGRVAVA